MIRRCAIITLSFECHVFPPFSTYDSSPIIHSSSHQSRVFPIDHHPSMITFRRRFLPSLGDVVTGFIDCPAVSVLFRGFELGLAQRRDYNSLLPDHRRAAAGRKGDISQCLPKGSGREEGSDRRVVHEVTWSVGRWCRYEINLAALVSPFPPNYLVMSNNS